MWIYDGTIEQQSLWTVPVKLDNNAPGVEFINCFTP